MAWIRGSIVGALALAVLGLAAPASASSELPAVGPADIVSAGTATGDGGNAWGGHQPRAVRTATGVFTAYSVPGRDTLHRRWRLAEQRPRGWRVIASGDSGREPPSLLAGPNGALYVIAWPSGLPRLWTITRTGTGWTARDEPVPGGWVQSDWPYATAAVGTDGSLYVLESNDFEDGPGGESGAFRLAVRDPSGRWSFQVTPTRYRYCYAWLEPTARGGLTVVATRAVRWHVLGYARPAGAFGYVYDSVRAWRSTAPAREPLVPSATIRTVRPNTAYPDVFASAAQLGVYRDAAGRVHVLYSVKGPRTRGRLQQRHAVLSGGRVAADVRLPVELGYAKVVEDARGRLFVVGTTAGSSTLRVYPATSPYGTELGPPTLAPLSGHALRYPGFTAADPRSGTPIADRADLVYASGRHSARWVHVAVTLP